MNELHAHFQKAQEGILREMSVEQVVSEIRRAMWPYRIMRRVANSDSFVADLASGKTPFMPEKMAEVLAAQEPLKFGFHPETKRIVTVEHLPMSVLGMAGWQVAYNAFLGRNRRYFTGSDVMDDLIAILTSYTDSVLEMEMAK